MNEISVLMPSCMCASVDSCTDAALQRMLRSSFSGVTVLAIAHRLETVLASWESCAFLAHIVYYFIIILGKGGKEVKKGCSGLILCKRNRVCTRLFIVFVSLLFVFVHCVCLFL